MRKPIVLLVSLILSLALTTSAAASPFAAGPSRLVLITLVGQNGEPVHNAVIQLLQSGQPQLVAARTDRSGQAVLTLPDGFAFWLRAWSEGNTVAEQAYVPTSDGMVVTMTATAYTASLHGIVTDERGRVVPEAEVTVWADGRGLQGTATSRMDGSYTLTGLRADGSYVVQVAARRFQPLVQTEIALNPGERNQLDVNLTPASGTITGEVTDNRTGRPLRNARIELLLNGWGLVGQTRTDGLGFFRLPVPPSETPGYQLRIWAADYETFVSEPIAMAPGDWTDFSGADQIALNPLYAELSGSVLNQNGIPLGYTPVELQLDGMGTIETGVTDGEGFYHFAQLPAGSYRVRALPTMGQIRGDSGWITLAGGQRFTADVSANNPDMDQYGTSSIVGTVRDHIGDPVAGASVTASRGGSIWRTTADSQGRYRFPADANVEDTNIDPEIATGYHIAVTAPGFIPSDLIDPPEGELPPGLFDVRLKRANRADFRLVPIHGEVAGRVLDDRGDPLPDITVVLRQEGGQDISRVRTNTLGQYRFADLEVAKQGRYLPVVVSGDHIEASLAPGGGPVDLTGLSPGSVTAQTLTVRPASITVQGLVSSGSDRPANGASVSLLRPADGKVWTGRVAADGTYAIKLPAVPGQVYLLRASSTDSIMGTSGGAVNPGASYGAVANASVIPYGSVQGKVYGSNGLPQPFTWVTLWAEGSGEQVGGILTDFNGSYRFAGLHPGRAYTVAAWGGGDLWSTLRPGEIVITPLLTPSPGQTLWTDLLHPINP